jgi:dethiobiotin synthetase
MKGIFVTGTDTNIGKTWVSVQLIKTLKRLGYNVAPRKPVESGWNPDIKKNDAWKLAKAADKLGQLDNICPDHFTQAISPARAASLQNRQITIGQLVKHCRYTQKANDFVVVEGAGGFYSPLAQDGLNSDFAQALGLPVLLVAENRLGCINQVLLSTQAIKTSSLCTTLVILNNKTAKTAEETLLRQDDLEYLKSRLDCPIITLDYNDTNHTIFTKIAEHVIQSAGKNN